MMYTLYGATLDTTRELGPQLERLLRENEVGPEYVFYPGITTWQGKDEDGEATKAFLFGDRWCVLYLVEIDESDSRWLWRGWFTKGELQKKIDDDNWRGRVYEPVHSGRRVRTGVHSAQDLADALNSNGGVTGPYLWDIGLQTWTYRTAVGNDVVIAGNRSGWFYAAYRNNLPVHAPGTRFVSMSNEDGSRLVNAGVEGGISVRDWIVRKRSELGMGSAEDVTTAVVDDMASFSGGGVRASEEGKPDFSLLWPKDVPYEEQFLYKLAMHMTRGAEKYAERNWEKFHDQEALDRALRSKMRHAAQDAAGETDEEHNIAEAANCMFKHTIEWKLRNGWTPDATS